MYVASKKKQELNITLKLAKMETLGAVGDQEFRGYFGILRALGVLGALWVLWAQGLWGYRGKW